MVRAPMVLTNQGRAGDEGVPGVCQGTMIRLTEQSCQIAPTWGAAHRDTLAHHETG